MTNNTTPSAQELHKSPPTGITGFKGVYKATPLSKKPYRAQITNPVNGLKVFLGYFDKPEDAAKAYDKEARRIYGADCYFNFS